MKIFAQQLCGFSMREAAMSIFGYVNFVYVRFRKGCSPMLEDNNKFDSVDGKADRSEPEAGRYLKNPLPVPKRRPHVRMEFDLADEWEVPHGQDHFDIEISDDDDFDI